MCRLRQAGAPVKKRDIRIICMVGNNQATNISLKEAIKTMRLHRGDSKGMDIVLTVFPASPWQLEFKPSASK
jgi:hypothetical protein